MSTIREFNLTVPLDADQTAELQPGDAVYLTGLIFTGREKVYTQIFDKDIQPEINIADSCNVNFHCSPAVTETAPGEYRIPSVTATASFRFAKYMERTIRNLGVRAVIGKAGMSPEIYQQAFRPYGAIYLTTVGYGLGAIYGRGITRVKDVFWKEELGLAQAMWILEVKKFGPFLVDYAGGDHCLFELENKKINPILSECYKGLEPPILKRLGEIDTPQQEML